MDADGLPVAYVEQLRVRCGEPRAKVSSDFRSNAISQTHRAARAVVVPCPEHSGGSRCPLVKIQGVEQVELREVEGSVFFVGSDDADQVVEYFGYPDHREGGWPLGSEQ